LPQGYQRVIHKGKSLYNRVTRILSAIEQGDTKAAHELRPLVYEELRLLTAQKLSHEQPGQTLQATALVHGFVHGFLFTVFLSRLPGSENQWLNNDPIPVP